MDLHLFHLAMHKSVPFTDHEQLCGKTTKGDGVANLMEDISRQLSIQAVSSLLLSALSQVYSENVEQKSEQKALKNVQIRSMLNQEYLAPLKGSQLLCLGTRVKMPWGHCRSQLDLTHHRAMVIKSVNSFERLSLEKRTSLRSTDHTGECFSEFTRFRGHWSHGPRQSG